MLFLGTSIETIQPFLGQSDCHDKFKALLLSEDFYDVVQPIEQTKVQNFQVDQGVLLYCSRGHLDIRKIWHCI